MYLGVEFLLPLLGTLIFKNLFTLFIRHCKKYLALFNYSLEERTGCAGLIGVDEMKFSGLYSYHVATNTWTHLYDDVAVGILKPGIRTLKCRTGHSMLFHPVI